MLAPSAAGNVPRRRSQGYRIRTSPVAAFTLIELLVSMTVTLLLVVALMQIFNAAASTWQHGEVQVDAYREARGAMQLMARDLSATLQASYNQPSGSGAATYAPSLPTLALQRYADPTPDATGPINEEVYCLTNIPNSGASTLCAVGYFCQWMPDIKPAIANPPQAYALMRQSLDSDKTFQSIQTATVAGKSPLTFDSFFTGSVASGSAVPTPTQLAAYIWDLRFRIDTDLNDTTTLDGNAAVPNAPTDHSMPVRYYRGDGNNKAQPYPPRLPAYVEIRFKALSEIAGRRLSGATSGVTKGTWNDTGSGFTATTPYRTIIQPNAQQFVLRVPLINATPLPTATP